MFGVSWLWVVGVTSPLRFICAAETRALRLFFRGCKPCFSTGIGGLITAGYGHLDNNGFWQYPLPWFFIQQHGWDI